MIANEGTISRAAARLHLTQPALSQQLSQIEAEFGAILFERMRRGVEPTPAGAIVLRHAQLVLHELEATRQELRELAGVERGSLVVGTTLTTNSCLMPQVVAHFSAQHPNIHVRIEEMSVDVIESRLLEGHFQLGFGFFPVKHEGIEAIPLFVEQYIVIVPHHHPLARHSHVAFRELASHRFALLGSRFGTRRLWDLYCQQANVQPTVLYEINAIGSILETVHQLNIATFLPAMALMERHASGMVGISLTDPTPQRTVGLLTRRQMYRDVTAHAFSKVVQQTVSTMKQRHITLCSDKTTVG